MVETAYTDLIAGALLHDIGKIVQRAAENSNATNHSNFGVKFLQLYANPTVLDCVRYHHAMQMNSAKLPPSSLAYVVYEADNIASSVDRRHNGGDEHGFLPKQSLASVFNKVYEHAGDAHTQYDMFSRHQTPVFYPTESKVEHNKHVYHYITEQWRNYFNTAQHLFDSNNLLAMSDFYTRYIPSSTDKSQVPDISLHNHTKLTAAIAGCAYYYFKEHNPGNFRSPMYTNTSKSRKQLAYLFVSGDISGIQDFLYTITNQQVIKSLRGRSQYLELLSENMIDEILSALQLCRANLLYNGGGHFYMLLPNLPKTKEVLTQMEQSCNDFFIQHFAGQLSLSISHIACSANEIAGLEGGSAAELFDAVNRKNYLKKQHRYTTAQLITLTTPAALAHTQECKICGMEHAHLHDGLCAHCISFIQFGGAVLNYQCETDALVVTPQKVNATSLQMPALQGQQFLSLVPFAQVDSPTHTYVLNQTQPWCEGAVQLLSANYTCREDAHAFTLEDYKNASQGIQRIAGLRMDVDNLGKLFREGLIHDELENPAHYATISRLADISDKISFFFQYEMNKLCAGRAISMIYSGGDDVFIIGAWDAVLQFALDFQRNLHDYFNGKLTVSAGYSMYHSKTPISIIAKDLESLQEYAKNEDADKNKICLFTCHNDTTFTWDDFSNLVVNGYERQLEHWFNFKGNKTKDTNDARLDFGMGKAYAMIAHIREIKDAQQINVARLMYLVARMKPTDQESLQMQPYKEMRKVLYNVSLKRNRKRLNALEMALTLQVYRNREGE